MSGWWPDRVKAGPTSNPSETEKACRRLSNIRSLDQLGFWRRRGVFATQGDTIVKPILSVAA
jgi:hypothetical protein